LCLPHNLVLLFWVLAEREKEKSQSYRICSSTFVALRMVELIEILAVDIADVSLHCEGGTVNGWAGHTLKRNSVGIC
jgi:hypothetical protein